MRKTRVKNRKTRSKKRKTRVKQRKRKGTEQTFIEYLNKQSPGKRIREIEENIFSNIFEYDNSSDIETNSDVEGEIFMQKIMGIYEEAHREQQQQQQQQQQHQHQQQQQLQPQPQPRRTCITKKIGKKTSAYLKQCIKLYRRR